MNQPVSDVAREARSQRITIAALLVEKLFLALRGLQKEKLPVDE